MFFNWMVVPKSQPEWVANAKSRPLLQATGDEIVAMLPEDPEKLLRGLKKGQASPSEDLPADTEGPSPTPPSDTTTAPSGRRTEAAPAGAAPTATAQDDRQGLNALLGKVNGSTSTKPTTKKQ